VRKHTHKVVLNLLELVQTNVNQDKGISVLREYPAYLLPQVTRCTMYDKVFLPIFQDLLPGPTE